jgi:hypothetical protein
MVVHVIRVYHKATALRDSGFYYRNALTHFDAFSVKMTILANTRTSADQSIRFFLPFDATLVRPVLVGDMIQKVRDPLGA